MPGIPGKKFIGVLVIAGLMVASLPTLVFADPAPTATQVEPSPTATPPPSPPSTATPPAPTATTTPNPSPNPSPPPSQPPEGSNVCLGRFFFLKIILKSIGPISPIVNFFSESICVAIVISSFAAGRIACSLISNFIEPIFPAENGCRPESQTTGAQNDGGGSSGTPSGASSSTSSGSSSGNSGSGSPGTPPSPSPANTGGGIGATAPPSSPSPPQATPR